jgi:hypothetical protein
MTTARIKEPEPWNPVGAETRIRSRRGGVVLVSESAEQVPPTNIARADEDRGR